MTDIIKIENATPHVHDLIELVNNGDADAMYELGVCLLKGEGCSVHTKSGIIILQEAKSRGSTKAADKLQNIDYLVNPPSQRRRERTIEQKKPKKEPLEVPWGRIVYISLTLIVTATVAANEPMDGLMWLFVLFLMSMVGILIAMIADDVRNPGSTKQGRAANMLQFHVIKSNLDRAETNHKLDEIADRLDF